MAFSMPCINMNSSSGQFILVETNHCYLYSWDACLIPSQIFPGTNVFQQLSYNTSYCTLFTSID